MILEVLAVGPIEANCYILADETIKEAIIIDPGADAAGIKKVLHKHGLKAALIINTHGHFDHIGADDAFEAPICIHEADARLLKDPALNYSGLVGNEFKVNSPKVKIVRDKEEIACAGFTLEVLHTPGHTPGGICLLLRNQTPAILFSGDTLFYHSIGRTDLPYSSESDLIAAIKKKIFALSDDTIVYPGHGPSSTVGRERKENPYVR